MTELGLDPLTFVENPDESGDQADLVRNELERD